MWSTVDVVSGAVTAACGAIPLVDDAGTHAVNETAALREKQPLTETVITSPRCSRMCEPRVDDANVAVDVSSAAERRSCGTSGGRR